MMATGLSHIFLLVSHLERSIHFYRQLLERAPVSEDARHARFDLDQVSLTIHEDLTAAEVLAWKVDPVPERRGWGVYLTFPTDDLDQTHRKLDAIGAEILTTPRPTPWGARMFLVKDPDGYLLEISQQ
jgi:catechol 2,3-dioxygenase-like lactoylglutathione lyase family enzyme